MRNGKITENALKRSVLKQLNTEFKHDISAAVGADCAFIASKKTFSAVCPVVIDVQGAAFYGVVKAVNSLVAQGIICDHISVSILLPQDSEEKDLKVIVADAIEGCRYCGVKYAGGHTEVTSAVTRSVITVSAIGYAEGEIYADQKPHAGDELVISKWIGLEGTAMIASCKKDELTGRHPEPFITDAIDFRKELSVAKEAAVAIKSGISAVHDISGGGVFAGLWEMSQRAGTGLKVNLRSIPIRQETVEICDFYEINPYRLLSGGALLFATNDAQRLVYDLNEAGINAVAIGRLQEGNDKVIDNLDESRFLEKPEADEILKVLS